LGSLLVITQLRVGITEIRGRQGARDEKGFKHFPRTLGMALSS
jgi:hypothetical protein